MPADKTASLASMLLGCSNRAAVTEATCRTVTATPRDVSDSLVQATVYQAAAHWSRAEQA